MGIFDRFRRVQPTVATWSADSSTYFGAYRDSLFTSADYDRIMGLSPADMWRTQPYLRTVVTFLARNIAQLGLHTYQRVSDDDRQRVRDGIAARLARPNRDTTAYELVYALVADLALFDVAYWLITDDPENPLTRLPVSWVTTRGGDAYGPEWYEVRIDDKGNAVRVDASNVLRFHGWSPTTLAHGSSPVHALKEILAEQVQAAKYREQVWRRGGKVGAVLSRPADAPEWSDDARRQFKRDWESKFTGQGSQVGGTPLLEDGMTLSRVDFSAHEMEFIEGARLALNTVASVYHINPTMIGLLDNANYSNVREFRRMLYGDTLGPILAQIEDRLNTFLVPRLDARPNLYVEFNIEEKLQGNFEEQTAAIQSSVGAPWLTRNEARALRNMPAIEGGDELVTPLNVLVGGQASPTDSAPTLSAASAPELRAKLYAVPDVKARPSSAQTERVSKTLTRFFSRQGTAVLSSQRWDGERWDRELADDLNAVASDITATLGKAEARRLGFSADEFSPEGTVNYLKAVAERYAQNINRTTKRQLDDERAKGDDAEPARVFAPERTDARAAGIATGVTTFLAGFAAVEAASQIARARDIEPTKTWSTGANPRSSHADMDGETVPLSEDFSNGLPWPGAAGGEAEEVANCNCELIINL